MAVARILLICEMKHIKADRELRARGGEEPIARIFSRRGLERTDV